jgi:hypothetical protein
MENLWVMEKELRWFDTRYEVRIKTMRCIGYLFGDVVEYEKSDSGKAS